jgi:hypothetical protein
MALFLILITGEKTMVVVVKNLMLIGLGNMTVRLVLVTGAAETALD